MRLFKYLFLLLFLLVPSMVLARGDYYKGVGVIAPVCIADQCETFETNPGYDLAWTEVNGDSDPDYSTADLDMHGSLCVKIPIGPGILEHDLAAPANEVYVLTKFRHADAMENDEKIFEFQDNADNALGSIYHESAGAGNRLYPLGSASRTAETNAVNVSSWMKFRYKKGTGANAIVGVSVWTGAAWGSWVLLTNGAATAQVNEASMWNGQDNAAEIQFWDCFQVKATDTDPFTANPNTLYCGVD